MGLRIPEDVAIVGYNDIPLASRLVPGLTTVHVPIHEFGSAAARLLLEQIETGDPIRRRVIFNPELIVRGSTVAGPRASARPRADGAAATQKGGRGGPSKNEPHYVTKRCRERPPT